MSTEEKELTKKIFDSMFGDIPPLTNLTERGCLILGTVYGWMRFVDWQNMVYYLDRFTDTGNLTEEHERSIYARMGTICLYATVLSRKYGEKEFNLRHYAKEKDQDILKFLQEVSDEFLNLDLKRSAEEREKKNKENQDDREK